MNKLCEEGKWKLETRKDGTRKYCLVEGVSSAERLEVPEEKDGIAVGTIGKYAFHGKMVKNVVIPKTVNKIEAHAFYDCRKMEKISISDHLDDIGDGAFKNCRSLRTVELFLYKNHYACLKNLLSELDQQIRCTLHIAGKEIQLLFPAYTHNYQENTMARLVNQETYGSGAHYRETVTKDGILYQEYDSHFYLACNVEQQEVAFLIALLRLAYPYELKDRAKVQYEKYLIEHWEKVCRWLVEKKEREWVLWLCEYETIDANKVKYLLNVLQQNDEIELVAEGMAIDKKRFGQRRKSFTL